MNNPEDQVTSLELSKKLKEAGYPQEGLFWWVKYKSSNEYVLLYYLSVFGSGVPKEIRNDQEDLIVAATSADLGVVMPYGISSWKNPENNEWDCHTWRGDGVYIHGKTEANARAKTLLYLVKTGSLIYQ